MSDKLTVGSLFAGIGGIELGLERTGGFETVWQVEQDGYCRRVLAKHWPEVGRFEDVRGVGAEELDPVDLICGGFPCQGISKAGKRKGLEDERSGLWSEMWRVIRELRPGYALVENVPNLRSMGLGVVLADLAEIGYDAEWDCFPASAFGAPHQRDRLFLVAYPCRRGRRGRVYEQERVTGGEREAHARSNGPQGNVADPNVQGLEKRQGERGDTPTKLSTACGGRLPGVRPGQWTSEPDVGRVADGVPDRVDRIRALGNAVVPQVAEWIGERILEHAEAA